MTVIYGINPVLEALNAGTRHFDRLLIIKGLRNRRVSEILSQASQMGIPLRFELREALDRMAGGLRHQGIIAVVSAKPVMTLDSLLEEVRDPGLLLLLDGLEDPRNLGAILRTAEAADVDGVLLPERHSAGLSEAVSRSSAGGLEYVKVARIGNVVQAIESLKSRGFWVVGFDACGPERWDTVDYRRSVVLVLGGEGRGTRRLVRERCDHVVSIPLFGHVGSLNVSVAAGIAMYEVIRQRGTVPSHLRPIPWPPEHTSPENPSLPFPARTDAPGGSPGGLEGEEDLAEWPPTPLALLEDEVAWGPPAVVSRERTPDMGSRPRRPRAGPRQNPRPRPPAVPASSPSDGGESVMTPGGGGGKRRHRRGRRRRRRPAAPQPPSGANAEAPVSEALPPPSEPGAIPRGRRRRRRR